MDCERLVGRIYGIQYFEMVLVEIEWTWIFLGNDDRNWSITYSSRGIPITSGIDGVPAHPGAFFHRLHHRKFDNRSGTRCGVDAVLYAGAPLGVLETGSR